MRLVVNGTASLDGESKAAALCCIFRNLKGFALEAVTVKISYEGIYAQGLDGAHVCLFELELAASWFDDFDFKDGKDAPDVAFSPVLFDRILGCRQSGQCLTLKYDGDPTCITISLKGGDGDCYDKTCSLPLMSVQSESFMNVPKQEYDVDLGVSSRRLAHMVDQLSLFGTCVDIVCTEDAISFKTQSDAVSMTIDLDGGDEEELEYAIIEELELRQNFSLRYLKLMLHFQPLRKTLYVGWKNDNPMTIKYELGIDSRLQFFMAPRINE